MFYDVIITVKTTRLADPTLILQPNMLSFSVIRSNFSYMKLKIGMSTIDFIIGWLIIDDFKLPKIIYELRQDRNSFPEEKKLDWPTSS